MSLPAAVPTLLTSDAVAFLATIPPFELLDAGELARLGETLQLEFYPRGFPILTQGGAPSAALQIVLTGSARVAVPSGDDEEVVIDVRSEGDAIGFLSLYSGDRSRVNVTAAEDATCLLIPREPFLRLLETHPDVREYLHRTFLAKYVDKAFTDMRSRSRHLGGRERLLFTTPVGEVASHAVETVPAGLSIREAAKRMSRRRISSVVVADENGVPVGIVTDRDLRTKVAARGRDTGEPVSAIMSSALVKADSAAYCFDALLTMIRHNIHHLLIVDGGRLRGMVTNHDLLVLQGSSPISLVREIEARTDVEGLVQAAAKVEDIVGQLLADGARAGNITRIVTEINDRLARKVIEFALRELGAAPLPWAWICFGSEGRREQTFRTDQDNALIYADPANPAEAGAAREWFLRFAQRVREGLVRCGFAPCPAGYMADNPRWNQPLSAWRELFSRWVANPGPEALLQAAILFDFRCLAGAPELAGELRAHLARASRSQRVFFARLAGTVTQNRPPLGFFGAFAVDRAGEHKNRLNLKVNGLGPIVNIARLYALESGVSETGTVERLAAARADHPLIGRYGDELAHAFEFLSLLRIHHQLEQLREGGPGDSFIDPEKLSRYEKKSLRDVFRLISRVQDLIVEEYRTGLVGA